jgi:hypothetical protein
VHGDRHHLDRVFDLKDRVVETLSLGLSSALILGGTRTR